MWHNPLIPACRRKTQANSLNMKHSWTIVNSGLTTLHCNILSLFNNKTVGLFVCLFVCLIRIFLYSPVCPRTQRSACLCLPSTGIKVVFDHHRPGCAVFWSIRSLSQPRLWGRGRSQGGIEETGLHRAESVA